MNTLRITFLSLCILLIHLSCFNRKDEAPSIDYDNVIYLYDMDMINKKTAIEDKEKQTAALSFFTEGKKAYEEKNYNAAIEAYKKGLMLYPSAREYYKLGNFLLESKQYEQSIQAYTISINLNYEKKYFAYYNSCCSYSLQLNKEKAFEYLQLALEAGYTSYNFLYKDPDVSFIREDARFDSIVQPYIIKEDEKKEITKLLLQLRRLNRDKRLQKINNLYKYSFSAKKLAFLLNNLKRTDRMGFLGYYLPGQQYAHMAMNGESGYFSENGYLHFRHPTQPGSENEQYDDNQAPLDTSKDWYIKNYQLIVNEVSSNLCGVHSDFEFLSSNNILFATETDYGEQMFIIGNYNFGLDYNPGRIQFDFDEQELIEDFVKRGSFKAIHRLKYLNSKKSIPYLIEGLAGSSQNYYYYVTERQKEIIKSLIYLAHLDPAAIVGALDSDDKYQIKSLLKVIGSALIYEADEKMLTFLQSHDKELVEDAIDGLGKLGKRKYAVHIQPFLDHEDESLQLAALYACDNLGDVKSIKPFYLRLHDNTFKYQNYMKRICSSLTRTILYNEALDVYNGEQGVVNEWIRRSGFVNLSEDNQGRRRSPTMYNLYFFKDGLTHQDQQVRMFCYRYYALIAVIDKDAKKIIMDKYKKIDEPTQLAVLEAFEKTDVFDDDVIEIITYYKSSDNEEVAQKADSLINQTDN